MAATHDLTRMNPDADRQESRFRLTYASLVTFFWFLLFLGTSWDVQWHSDVGPDEFWTAPHTMMYAGVAVAGLISLYVVIATTIKVRRGIPGPTRENTTLWFSRFRAPLGFIVSGVGVTAFLISGGFDEFWHGLYGFDVTLWSPPHISLMLSAIVGIYGVVYAFGSEVSRARARGEERLLSPASIGFTVAVGMLLAFTTVMTPPAMTEKPFLGPFSLWPLMAGAIFTFGLTLSASVLRLPGAATMTAAVVTLARLVIVVLPPRMVAWQAAATGLDYKPDMVGFTLGVLAAPALLMVAGLVIDLVFWFGRRHLSLAKAAVVAGALSPVVLFSIDRPWFTALDVLPWISRFESVHTAMLQGHLAAFYPTMGAVAILGATAGWLGWHGGILIRYTDK